MAFTEHKITSFKHKIADLADQPNLPSADLKARFDSSPEELRLAHNNLCDDAARLDERVSSILNETFDGAIEKPMLSPELSAELDAKAEKTALDAEVTAREDADTKLTIELNSLKTTVDGRTVVHFGSYSGDGTSSRSIQLPVTPKVIIVASTNMSTVVALPQGASGNNTTDRVASLSGSSLRLYTSYALNNSGIRYSWIAFV